MDTWQHWPGCGTYPSQPARSGLLGMQKSVRRQKLCEREQERERNGGAATLELLNQRGKEFENVCHRRRIRIGGRRRPLCVPTPYLQLKCRPMDAVLGKAEKCWKKLGISDNTKSDIDDPVVLRHPVGVVTSGAITRVARERGITNYFKTTKTERIAI